MKRLEADIEVSGAAMAGQIETTRKRVTADRAAFALADQAVQAEINKLRAGTSATLAVLQLEQYPAAKEDSMSAAVAAERSAIATYDQELGAAYSDLPSDDATIDAQ